MPPRLLPTPTPTPLPPESNGSLDEDVATTGCKEPYCILLSTDELSEGNLLPATIPALVLDEDAGSEEPPAPTSSGRRFPLGGRGGTRLLKLATISGGE